MIPWALLLAAATLPDPPPVVARDPVLPVRRRLDANLVERIEADADALPLLGLIPGPREVPPGRPGCPRCDGTGTATRTATGKRVPGHRCPACRRRG